MESKRVAKIAKYFKETENGVRGEPISMQVALTDKCFNRCIMCDHPDRKHWVMDVDKWIHFLSSKSKVESVCYSGGDPMAHPNFNKVMQYHIDFGVAFGITCSGYIPPTIDLDLLNQADWVRVSLDAIDPDVYDLVRGKTPIEKIFLSIDKMIGYGVNVELGVTLHKENESQWPLIQEYAKTKGIKIDMRSVYPMSGVGDVIDRDILPFNNCAAALYQLYIGANGDVYPCCITNGDTKNKPMMNPLGNIFDDQWQYIWSNVFHYSNLSIGELPSICRTCCVQRLSEINNVVGNIKKAKSFF